MNKSKFITGGLLGAVAFFASSFLTYEVLFGSSLDAASPAMKSIMSEQPEMITLCFGCLGTGMLIAYLFEVLGSVRTLMGGMYHGVIIGGLMAIGYDAMMLATTNIYSWNGLALDTLINMINFGVSGAVVAWWLGFNRN